MKNLLAILFGLLLLGLPSLSFGDAADLYQVNLIIVKHLSAKALTSEQWSAIKQSPDLTNSTQITPLADNKLQLKSELRRLKRSKNFQVLLATSWQQLIPVTDNATPMQISGGTAYNNIDELTGTITITLDRYFNVKINLLLTEPKTYLDNIGHGNYASTITNNKFIRFQLLQNRRMKSNELNYINHPLFGALVIVTPIKNKMLFSKIKKTK